MTENCWKSSYICAFILSKKQHNWLYKNLHNSGMVGRRKLPDPSLNCIFTALSIGVQYTLSFQWTNFGLKCQPLSKCHPILLGDFNSEMTDTNLKDISNLYLLKNLIKKPTCFKNLENPKTIYLILTNRQRSFCNSLETELSDFHKLTVTVLKTFFKKQSTKVISYWNYKNFSNDSFRSEIINEISSNNILEGDLTVFLDACKKSLDHQAPRKKKYTGAI